MRTFRCDRCGQLVFFENSLCLRCRAPLGFVPSQLRVAALVDDLADARRCANLGLAGCNWVVESPDGPGLCRSCATTAVRPADGDPEGITQFATAEAAKRRALFQLLDLGLPVDARTLRFELRSSTYEPVTTGHRAGVITLDLAESDDVRREARRRELGEPYRTTLGHFRHELGHYYQDILVASAEDRSRCRALFGDERAGYRLALERHYAQGPPGDWPARFVSAYATMHPWEDWAETFAHYLHIRDTLQTAADFGVHVEGPSPAAGGDGPLLRAATRPQAGVLGFQEMLDAWLPLTYALNQLNRSMGNGDLYPFTLSGPAVEKLAFVHALVQRREPHAGHSAERSPRMAPSTVRARDRG